MKIGRLLWIILLSLQILKCQIVSYFYNKNKMAQKYIKNIQLIMGNMECYHILCIFCTTQGHSKQRQG